MMDAHETRAPHEVSPSLFQKDGELHIVTVVLFTWYETKRQSCARRSSQPGQSPTTLGRYGAAGGRRFGNDDSQWW